MMVGVGSFDGKVPRAEPGSMTVDKNGRGIVERKRRKKGGKKKCRHVMQA